MVSSWVYVLSSQAVWCGRSEVGEEEMDPLLWGRDRHYLLRGFERIRPGAPRRRDHGEQEMHIQYSTREPKYAHLCFCSDACKLFLHTFKYAYTLTHAMLTQTIQWSFKRVAYRDHTSDVYHLIQCCVLYQERGYGDGDDVHHHSLLIRPL